jgi:MiaB-like tRNA modifying enzyme
MQQKTIYIETYGCSANQNNSEILAGILSRAGNIVTNNKEIADIIILNTCVVKSKTESKIKKIIQDLKAQGNKKLIIISGCMPETDFKKIKRINPNVIFLGTHHFKDILNVIRDYQEKKLDEKKQQEYLEKNPEIKLNLPKLPQNKLISIHQISEGCLGNCSYCKTKLAKGNLFSYPQEEIIKSIESDLSKGAKEIWLTSQDNAAYGLDWKDKKRELPSLLKEILNLKHKFKLRLGMSDPNNILPILDELLEVYKNSKMYRFLHIPIQSASNKVLKDMNRFYTIEEAETIIAKFKKAFPEGVIATDIIVGYPTETQEDHNLNKKFLEKYHPEVLNLSKFSSHKQTRAGKLKVLSNGIVRKRTTELMNIHKQTAKEHKKQYLNKTIEVFINKKIHDSDSLHEARDENYNKVFLKANKEDLGKELEVKITSIGVHNLVGELARV